MVLREAAAMDGNGEGKDGKCNICDVLWVPNHKSSLKHRFNFMLWEWSKYRKGIVKNRHGVEVDVSLVDVVNGNQLRYWDNPRKGSHVTKGTVEQVTLQQCRIKYLFNIRNKRSTDVFIMNAFLLHPYSYFKLDDFEGSLNGTNILQLEPGAVYSFKVVFQPEYAVIGSMKIPVAIQFQTEKDQSFTITREIVIVISDQEEITSEKTGKSPFTNAIWSDVDTWIKPNSNKFSSMNLYRIPKEYRRILKMGLEDFGGMAAEQLALLQDVKNKLYPGYVTSNNYRDYFHIVLWLDEMGAELMLRRYNMENVTMVIKGKFLELAVPGLAEKRPSLIVGDIVNIRLHEDHIAYKGAICRIHDKTIWIEGVNKELVEDISEHPDRELDVAFQLGRLPYERMHAGVDQCYSNKMMQCLFPDPELVSLNSQTLFHISDSDFINRDIVQNEEQKGAVENILNCKSGKAPYIVFGPPGTGKTVTIVEAILQIKKRVRNSRILVCAPANAACDMLTLKLIPYCTKTELIRVHSASREWDSVPEEVKLYSNHIDRQGYTRPSGIELMEYRIVITTLVLSGRYAANQTFFPDFVFIDEAAQAMEPEADIAIALLRLGKQLVLAGDPKQLGPQCSSAVAEKYKLGVSLLERLMKTPIYMNYHPNCITMLKNNFRAHPVVLQLPNDVFYDGQLKAVSKVALHDPLAKLFIYHKIPLVNFRTKNAPKFLAAGQPVEFCAVFAKERREGRSPSYFNPSEVEMVIKYVKALTSLSETKVDLVDIGIVTPYIRQMYRIKEKLKMNGFEDIEVGTTEVFQGREKRVIIISTVRAQHSLLLHDRRYKLGFIKNEKRFNVALTRAMSKLIIIGCPNVLRYDDNWLKYIEFCVTRHAYFGAQFDRRTDAVKTEVMHRVNHVYYKDSQYLSQMASRQ